MENFLEKAVKRVRDFFNPDVTLSQATQNIFTPFVPEQELRTWLEQNYKITESHASKIINQYQNGDYKLVVYDLQHSAIDKYLRDKGYLSTLLEKYSSEEMIDDYGDFDHDKYRKVVIKFIKARVYELQVLFYTLPVSAPRQVTSALQSIKETNEGYQQVTGDNVFYQDVAEIIINCVEEAELDDE